MGTGGEKACIAMALSQVLGVFFRELKVGPGRSGGLTLSTLKSFWTMLGMYRLILSLYGHSGGRHRGTLQKCPSLLTRLSAG